MSSHPPRLGFPRLQHAREALAMARGERQALASLPRLVYSCREARKGRVTHVDLDYLHFDRRTQTDLDQHGARSDLC